MLNISLICFWICGILGFVGCCNCKALHFCEWKTSPFFYGFLWYICRPLHWITTKNTIIYKTGIFNFLIDQSFGLNLLDLLVPSSWTFSLVSLFSSTLPLFQYQIIGLHRNFLNRFGYCFSSLLFFFAFFLLLSYALCIFLDLLLSLFWVSI